MDVGMDVRTQGQPTASHFTIDCNEVCTVVEFSQFEWSSELLACCTTAGVASHVRVLACRFQGEASSIEDLEYESVYDVKHGPRVTAFAWSPETSLTTVPRVLKFCTAGADRKLRLFSSELSGDTQQVMSGHTSYVNSVTFDPDKGDRMASVGDDYTCRVWGDDGSQIACFPLGSPGMSVCWHQELMVGEKKGVIRFYNMETCQPIISLDCGTTPLMAADWCYNNLLSVVAVSGQNICFFDTSTSSNPKEIKLAFTGGSKCVRWSRGNENLVACTGSPGGQIKVFHMKHNQPLFSTTKQISYGLSWHYRLPVLAVGGDRQLQLWRLKSF